MTRDEQVRGEIETFLHALDSYPDHFARDPQITFEEHRSSLTGAANDRPRQLSLKAS